MACQWNSLATVTKKWQVGRWTHERLNESCEECNPEGAEILLDNILDEVMASDPSVTDYILEVLGGRSESHLADAEQIRRRRSGVSAHKLLRSE